MTGKLHFPTTAEAPPLPCTRQLAPADCTDALVRRSEGLGPPMTAFIKEEIS